MSDDVKVKFSGDFKDVSKGAQEASKNAGTAMGAWVGEFTNSIKSSLVNMASLTFIFDKVKEGISGAIERVFELNKAIRKTGVDAADFQKVFAITKQFGVDVETTGNAVSFFSKMMGQAALDSEKHGKALKELGFSNKEIKEGTISASDALIALSTYLEKTGSEYKTAALAAELFGKKTGKELLVAIREGSGALKDQADNAKILSDAQREAAEATERAWTRVLLKLKSLWLSFVQPILKGTAQGVIVGERASMEEEYKKKGLPTQGVEFEKELARRLKEKGVGYEFQKEYAEEQLKQREGPSLKHLSGRQSLSTSENAVDVLSGLIKEQKEKEEAAKKAERERIATEEFENQINKTFDQATEASKEAARQFKKKEKERIRIGDEAWREDDSRMKERIRLGDQYWREEEENAKAIAEGSKGLAVSSLQAIGGGDIASIGMLGPQEKIEMNTASAAASLKVIETNLKPATPGAPSMENKAK
jgi:hypothetical protein